MQKMTKLPSMDDLRRFSTKELLELRANVDQAYREGVEAEKKALRDRWQSEAEELGLTLETVIGAMGKSSKGKGMAYPREFYHHPNDPNLTANVRGKMPSWATEEGIERKHLVKVRQNEEGGALTKISDPEMALPGQ